jgi:hypothetical protein
MSRSSSQILLAVIIIATATSGCLPFGDCWPPVTAQVSISPEFADKASVPIIVAGVPRIYDTDVSGVDQQGVPVSPDGLTPFATGSASGTTRSVTLAFHGYPYPTWYVAFLDLNGNRSLNIGEPFGVDPLNPQDTFCNAQNSKIDIATVRTEPGP